MKCLQVAGDDLLMSDPERIKRAVNEYTCNALVLKASIKSSICVFFLEKDFGAFFFVTYIHTFGAVRK